MSIPRLRTVGATALLFCFAVLVGCIDRPVAAPSEEPGPALSRARSRSPGGLGSAALVAPAKGRTDDSPKTSESVHHRRSAHGILLSPATPPKAEPKRDLVTVMLHGMCGTPQPVCELFEPLARPAGWLVCPRGNVACGSSFDWAGDGEAKAEQIDAVLASLPELSGDTSPRTTVLMGFSRGAFVARDVAYARPGRFQALVLIGAALKPSAKKLRASGIERVVLASGRFDGARATMQHAARLLNRDGIPTRFVDLGKIWHQLPSNASAILGPHYRWAVGP